MNKSSEATPLDRLGRAIKSLQLVEIYPRFKKSETFIHPGSILPEEAKLEDQTNIKWQFTKNDRDLLCFVNFRISGSNKNDGRPLFSIQIENVLHYQVLAPKGTKIEPHDIEIFCKTNAYYNAYPFIREFIIQSSAELRLEPIVLPLLRPYTKRQIEEMFSESNKEAKK